MYVSVCNYVGVSEQTLTNAKIEARLAFEDVGVNISWVACGSAANSKLERGEQLFLVRLLGDSPRRTSRSLSLEAMGRAYTEGRESGLLADAYVRSVRSFSTARQIDEDALLGLVITHELGHLLLGPGHASKGVMQGVWKPRETEAIRKRWLRFNRDQEEIIQQELVKRADAPPER